MLNFINFSFVFGTAAWGVLTIIAIIFSKDRMTHTLCIVAAIAGGSIGIIIQLAEIAAQISKY